MYHYQQTICLIRIIAKSRIIINSIVNFHIMKNLDLICILLLWLIGLLYLTKLSLSSYELSRIVNQRSLGTLQHLVETKFFRIIRLNINQDCPLGIMNKICKSKSCSACRCNQQDIPQNWVNTQRVKSHLSGQDLWHNQRDTAGSEWVWHVQDENNDKGEYFDLHSNIQSFTNYNGSYIWKIIYEQNCFNHKYEDMCVQERLLYQIISGLHASISTHLCRFYRYIPEQNKWADLKPTNLSEKIYYLNATEYQSRLLKNPQRINNLLFVFRLLAKAVVEAGPYLVNNFTIFSNDIAQDILAKNYLKQLLEQLKGYDLSQQDQHALTFFKPGNPMVKQYQSYIHNISDILNCVQCQKCRLFFKMQTYGIGTALKILLGYPTPYKRNQIVALLNVFSKVSFSVHTYFSQSKNFPQESYKNLFVTIYLVMGGLFFLRYAYKKYKSNKKKEQLSNKKQ